MTSPPPATTQGTNLAYLAAIGATIFWGTTFAISKFVLPDPLGSWAFTAIRTVFGLAMLLLYIAVSGQFKALIDVIRRNFWSLMLVGVIFYGFAYVVQYWGMSHTMSSHQAILSETQTLWVVVFNFLVFRRKPQRIFLLGVIIAFIGVVLIFTNADFSFSPDTIVGDTISIFAFILWGGYSAFAKPIAEKEKPMLVTVAIIFWGTVMIVPFSLAMGGAREMAQLTANQWLIMIYLGVVCIGVSFVLWNWALSNKAVPSENVAIISMLNPITGVVTSFLWLEEIITGRMIVGCILILLSLCIVEFKAIKSHPKAVDVAEKPPKSSP